MVWSVIWVWPPNLKFLSADARYSSFRLATRNEQLSPIKNSVKLRWIMLCQKLCWEISGQQFLTSQIQHDSTLKDFYRNGSRWYLGDKPLGISGHFCNGSKTLHCLEANEQCLIQASQLPLFYLQAAVPRRKQCSGLHPKLTKTQN